jgi:hypothetical protein
MTPNARINLPGSFFLAALLLRLFFSAFFFHPDIKSQHFHAQFLSRGVFDIYAFVSKSGETLPYRDTFNYPPFTYYLLGTWNMVSQMILGGQLTDWLNDWGPQGYFNPHTFEMMLVLKLPYLFFDFLIALLLTKFSEDSVANRKLLIFWFFNPVSLYAIYMLSQFDVICAAFTLLALLLVKKGDNTRAAFLLGLGTMLKSYPLLLFPFILFRSGKPKNIVIAIISFLLGAALPTLPVILSPQFHYAMTHSNLMQRIFEAGIDIGGGQKLPLYVVIYTFTLWLSWQRRQNKDLLPEFLTTTLTVLLVSHYHAQWAVWSLPFIALFFSRSRLNLLPLLLLTFIGYFVTNLLVYDQYVFLGLFTAINPLAIVFPPLASLVQPVVDPGLLQSLAHTLLAGSGATLLYIVWKHAHEK